MSAEPGLNGLDWAVAERTFPGETQSGDGYAVVPFRGGALVAVVDGLGHGSEAAHVARRALAVLEESPHEQPLSLIRRCHEELRGSRGVAMTLVRLDWVAETLTWLGVGNVEGRLLRADDGTNRWRDAAPLRGGVVGYQVPPLRPAVLPFGPGDTLVLATDGIRPDFGGVRGIDEPQRLASQLLARYARASDDALVLVARHAGEAA